MMAEVKGIKIFQEYAVSHVAILCIKLHDIWFYTLRLTFNLTDLFLKMLSQNQHKYIDSLQ